ncbi:MAG: putative phosphotransacetylase [Frankiales bacterium]|nr:putative phosphotransacetylase [Frankiales bacterium]
MSVAPRCPRCSGALRPPGLMSSDWTCAEHGRVQPWYVGPADVIPKVAATSRVPLWAPQLLIAGWTVGGIGWCGDERTGATATVLACSGPSPLGGPADMLLISEEPAVGLGAALAGFPGLDPGGIVAGAPDAKLLAANHPTALWRCESANDRVAFVGEAGGVWLWAVLWPPAAELVLLEHVELHDLRHDVLSLAAGAPSPRLR